MSTNNSIVSGIAYYRMSSDAQEASIPAQQKWIEEAAKREGIRIVAEFDDPGIPGGEIEHRPGLQAALDYCEREFRVGAAVDCVLVWDPDRLSRATSIKTAAVLSALQDAGVSRLLTASDGWVDLDDATHRVLYLLKQDLARNGFCEALARNVLRGQALRAARGLWVGGPIPFGYRLNAGRLEPHPEYAAVLKWLFTAYASGAYSLNDLCDALHERGIKPPMSRSAYWRSTTLTRIFRREVYLGHFVWNQRHGGRHARLQNGRPVKDTTAKDREQERRRSGNKKYRPIDNDAEHHIRFDNTHEPLIDELTFQTVQRRLDTNRNFKTPCRGGGKWLLSGMLYCGACGERMHGMTVKVKGHEYLYYICTNASRRSRTCRASKSIPANRLLDEVIAEIQSHFADGPALDELQRQLGELLDNGAEYVENEGARLRERLEQLDKQIEQGITNLAVLPANLIADVAAKVQDWKEEREKASRQLTALERSGQEREGMGDRIQKALAELQLLHETIRTAPPALARAGLSDVVSRVTVHYTPAEKVRDMQIDAIEVEINPVLLGCCERIAIRGGKQDN